MLYLHIIVNAYIIMFDVVNGRFLSPGHSINSMLMSKFIMMTAGGDWNADDDLFTALPSSPDISFRDGRNV